MPGFVWVQEPCPSCGRPWWLGAERALIDPVAASGLTFEGEVAMATLRYQLGACGECR